MRGAPYGSQRRPANRSRTSSTAPRGLRMVTSSAKVSRALNARLALMDLEVGSAREVEHVWDRQVDDQASAYSSRRGEGVPLGRSLGDERARRRCRCRPCLVVEACCSVNRARTRCRSSEQQLRAGGTGLTGKRPMQRSDGSADRTTSLTLKKLSRGQSSAIERTSSGFL